MQSRDMNQRAECVDTNDLLNPSPCDRTRHFLSVPRLTLSSISWTPRSFAQRHSARPALKQRPGFDSTTPLSPTSDSAVVPSPARRAPATPACYGLTISKSRWRRARTCRRRDLARLGHCLAGCPRTALVRNHQTAGLHRPHTQFCVPRQSRSTHTKRH